MNHATTKRQSPSRSVRTRPALETAISCLCQSLASERGKNRPLIPQASTSLRSPCLMPLQRLAAILMAAAKLVSSLFMS